MITSLECTIKGLSNALMEDLKPVVTEQITEQLVAEFKKEIEPVVAEAVKNLTLEHVHAYHDIANMREKLDIVINGVKINEHSND